MGRDVSTCRFTRGYLCSPVICKWIMGKMLVYLETSRVFMGVPVLAAHHEQAH